MKLYNWTLSVIAPDLKFFTFPQFGIGNAEKEVRGLVAKATRASGEKPEVFIEWLANIGCAVSQVIFFDGLSFDPRKINLILVTSNSDLAPLLREEKHRAPKSVNYFYSTHEWLRELPGEGSFFQPPQWILGVIASPHVMLSKNISDSALETLFLPARNRFTYEPFGNIADLVAADVYVEKTLGLPPENSLRKVVSDFKKTMEQCGVTNQEMTKLAIRSMEKRRVKNEMREPVMRAFTHYR